MLRVTQHIRTTILCQVIQLLTEAIRSMLIRKGNKSVFHPILVLIDPKENLSKSQVINRQMLSSNEEVTKKINTTLMSLKNRKVLIHLLLDLMFIHLFQVIAKNSLVRRIKPLSPMITHSLMMHRLKKNLNLIPKIRIKKISALL